VTGDSRELILRRIRAANRAVARAQGDAGVDDRPEAERASMMDAEYAALPREYLAAHHDPASHDIVALFAERAADYRAVVEQVPATDLPAAVGRAVSGRTSMILKTFSHIERKSLQDHGDGGGPGEDAPPGVRFMVPEGLPGAWVSRCAEDCPGVELIDDNPPLSAVELDAVAGVITGCAVAIAETGTIVLDHGPGQGRRALSLVPDFHLVVVEAAQIAPDLAEAFGRLDPSRPHTLISGPSATSDIELVRVEGVHGPRNLHVLIAAPG
jgi:L-lactate dehydrogenase complex protein LldG